MAPSGSRSKKDKKNKKQKKKTKEEDNNKGSKAKSKQLVTLNRIGPVPQVFKKVALSDANGVNTVLGNNLPVWFLGGATVGSMPDWANIIYLYNRYKMVSIKYTFNIQTTGALSLFNYDMPKIYIRYNYDSNQSAGLNGVNILNKMQEVPNAKVFQFTAEHTTFSYTYYPRCIEPVYLSSVSTGYKLAKPQYIDTLYSSVPHYGLMWYVDYLTSGIKMTYDIQYETAFKYEM